jgi:thioredoxin reductase (NADPH)
VPCGNAQLRWLARRYGDTTLISLGQPDLPNGPPCPTTVHDVPVRPDGTHLSDIPRSPSRRREHRGSHGDIATGARYRRLNVPRIDELTGLGIYYAATPMEAAMCGGSHVAIVGGGNSGGQAAVFLAQKVGKVTLMIRGDELERSMSRYLIDELDRTANIEVRLRTEVAELVGERSVEALVVENNRTGERSRLDATALFVFIGADPRTSWLDGVLLDAKGFVLTGRELDGRLDGDARPLPLETSHPGVFAVGDVRSGSIKRVASAVGEGSMAVRLVHQHLAER